MLKKVISALIVVSMLAVVSVVGVSTAKTITRYDSMDYGDSKDYLMSGPEQWIIYHYCKQSTKLYWINWADIWSSFVQIRISAKRPNGEWLVIMTEVAHQWGGECSLYVIGCVYKIELKPIYQPAAGKYSESNTYSNIGLTIY